MSSEHPIHDIVIAHGKNWRNYPPKGATAQNFRLELSLESKLTALAAWELYSQKRVKKVLFSTGKTAGKDFPSEAQAMNDFLARTGRIIPEEAVIFEEISFDTQGNAKECKSILEEKGLTDIAILTIKDHLKRTTTIYQTEAIPVTAQYASEDVVDSISHHHANFVRRYSHSARRRVEQLKEAILLAENKVDKKGKLLSLLTRRIRHQ